MLEHEPDAALVARFARTRDHDALERLLERRWAGAYRLALRALGSAAAAEDVAQHAFLDLVDAAPRFDPARPFEPWFRALVLNRVRKQARSAARRRAHERRAAAGRPEATRDRADAALDAERVAARVADLPEDVRLPVVLHYYEGLSHAEVAEAVGCPKGTAASRIRRGLEQLQGALLGGAALALPDLEALLRGTAAAVPPTPGATALLARASQRAARALPRALGAAALLAAIGATALLALPPPPSPTPPPAAVSSASTTSAATARRPAVPPAPARAPAQTARAGPGAGAGDPAPAAGGLPPGGSSGGAGLPAPGNAMLEVRFVDDVGQAIPVPLTVRAHHAAAREGGWSWEEPLSPRADVPPGGVARLPLAVDGRRDVGLEVAVRDERYPLWQDDGEGPMGFWYTWSTLPPDGHLVSVGPGQNVATTCVIPRQGGLAIRVSGVSAEASIDLRIDNLDHRGTVFGTVPPGLTRRGVAVGPARLRLACAGYETYEQEVQVEPGRIIDVNVDFQAVTRRVFGRVVDAGDGRPVPATRVWSGPHAVETAADGTFVLWLDRGAAELQVEAAGFCRDAVGIGADVELRVALVRGATLAVRVADEAGAPRQGVEVRVRGDRAAAPGLRHRDEVRLDLRRESPGRRWTFWPALRGEAWGADTTTDAEGRAALDHLPPGAYEVSIGRGSFYNDHGWTSVTLRAGQVASLELRAP